MAGTHDVRVCKSPEDIAKTFEVMQELRPHLEAHTYPEWIAELQEKHDYQLVGRFDLDGICVSVAGVRIEEGIAGKRRLFVDDLVTTEAQRGSGHGKAVLDWLKDNMPVLGVPDGNLVLLSGTQREAAHRFYRREGLVVDSVLMVLQDEINGEKTAGLTFKLCQSDADIAKTYFLLGPPAFSADPAGYTAAVQRRLADGNSHLLGAFDTAGSCVAAVRFESVHLLFLKGLAQMHFIRGYAMADDESVGRALLQEVATSTKAVSPSSSLAILLCHDDAGGKEVFDTLGFKETAYQFSSEAKPVEELPAP